MMNPVTQPYATNARTSASVEARVLLRAKGLVKSFGGLSVLNGVDVTLNEGEVVLLRGENGSGKTTLINILTGNLEPDGGTIEYLADASPQTCRFPRSWAGQLIPLDHFTPELVAREGLGRTWQDIRLFRSQTLRDNIAVAHGENPGEHPLFALFAGKNTALREAEINRQADAVLARLGLSGRELSSADMVSLGQSKRVAIARAVAAGARMLLLDEPLAGLDHHGIEAVLELLRYLVKEHGLTLVIVEHVFNFRHLHQFVGVHWTLAGGRILRESATGAQTEGSLSENAHSHWIDAICSTSEPVPAEMLPRGAILSRFRIPGRYAPEPVVRITGLVVRRGSRTVIGSDDTGTETGFDLTLNRGEIAILQAPNGWGKSTLLEAVAGIIPTAAGSVQIQDREITGAPAWDRFRRGLCLNSAASRLFPNLTVAELAALAGQNSRIMGRIRTTRHLRNLSGGELRRVSLRLLLDRSPGTVALLDEPMLGLDAASARGFAREFLSSTFSTMLIAEPLRGRSDETLGSQNRHLCNLND